jgi:predicted GNAT family N-acyltransferase
MMVSIKKVSSQHELQECLSIRHEVFVKGQNVPLEEELDGKDEGSEHYLLKVDTQPVGVARVRYINDYAKIERVAILDSFQNQGLGKKLMLAIIKDLEKQMHLKSAHLSSQTHAVSFYENLGFTVCSEEYLDAGIPHKDMQHQLMVQ